MDRHLICPNRVQHLTCPQTDRLLHSNGRFTCDWGSGGPGPRRARLKDSELHAVPLRPSAIAFGTTSDLSLKPMTSDLSPNVVLQRARADHMTTDTVVGGRIGIHDRPDAGANDKRQAHPKEKLPLTQAIVRAICQDQPFDPCLRSFSGMRNEE
jgi:hypothetical protein